MLRLPTRHALHPICNGADQPHQIHHPNSEEAPTTALKVSTPNMRGVSPMDIDMLPINPPTPLLPLTTVLHPKCDCAEPSHSTILPEKHHGAPPAAASLREEQPGQGHEHPQQ
jgi:hypothetical protein